MSQDPNETTTPPDVTIMRPRPGRRLAAVVDSPRLRAEPVNVRSQAPTEGPGASFVAFLTGGINPLVQAAAPLLILAGRLREQIGNPDVDRSGSGGRLGYGNRRR